MTGPAPAPPAPAVAARLRPTLAGRAERVLRWLLRPEDPLFAVDLRPRAVSVLRAERRGKERVLAGAATFGMAADALVVSMTEPNVRDAEAVRVALAAAVDRVGGAPGGPVALVLPDPVARLALVPNAEVAGQRRAQVDELLRFKLRKALPFDVRHARLDFAEGPPETGLTLVAAVHQPVLQGYEDLLRSVGLQAGLVEPSSLTLLGTAFGSRSPAPRLLVNWDGGYVTLVVARGPWPVVVRTLTGDAAATTADVAREVASTLVYFRERLGGGSLEAAAVRSTAVPPQEAASTVAAALGVPPSAVNVWSAAIPGLALADAQGLAAAAAVVLGRPA